MENVKEKYQRLVSEAPKIFGVSERSFVPPSWFDLKKYVFGQKLIRKHQSSMFLSNLIGLLLILQLPNGVLPLLATGNSKTIAKLFRRYLRTIDHVLTWFDSNPFEEKSRAFQSLKQVRKAHTKVSKYLLSNESLKLPNDRIWVSQYDMVLTQWSFVGAFIMFPKECGLHNISTEQMAAIIYVWRVLSYLNGINDEFNLCCNDYKDSKAICTLVWENEFKLPIMKEGSKVGLEMTKGIGETMKFYITKFSWFGFMKYWYRVFDLPIEIKLNTLADKIFYHLLLLFINYLMRFDKVKYVLALAIQKKHEYLFKIYDKVEKKLEKNFPNIEYIPECPFHFDVSFHEFTG